MNDFIKKHGTPEDFAIAIIKAIPEISIDEAVSAIKSYGEALQTNNFIINEKLAMIESWIKEVTPPCKHKGCYNHITHPCENCGRIQGRITIQELEKRLDKLLS